MMKYLKKKNGFTLIEIMVSIAISSLVIAGVYGVYTIQQRSYTVQEQVSEMQQRIRAAVDFMSREMRMAGYNPPAPYDPADDCDDAEISLAEEKKFSFSYCDVEENTDGTFAASLLRSVYRFYDAYNDNNGTPDALGIERDDGSVMPIAEGIDAIEFRYIGGNGVPLPASVADPSTIRAVEISMLVRSTYPDMKHTDSVLYVPRSGKADWISPNPPNDNFHRRLLTTTIYLRNMGIQ